MCKMEDEMAALKEVVEEHRLGVHLWAEGVNIDLDALSGVLVHLQELEERQQTVLDEVAHLYNEQVKLMGLLSKAVRRMSRKFRKHKEEVVRILKQEMEKAIMKATVLGRREAREQLGLSSVV